MRRIEVVNVFVFTEFNELSTGRLLLRDNTPIFTEHPDKQRPHLHLDYIHVNMERRWVNLSSQEPTEVHVS